MWKGKQQFCNLKYLTNFTLFKKLKSPHHYDNDKWLLRMFMWKIKKDQM